MPTLPPLPVDLSGIRLDPGQGLARQLYQALRERILDGRLRGGSRLPASRDLA
ncbi:GntR family transcriptional regulator, partial [Stutzerimonas balearica]